MFTHLLALAQAAGAAPAEQWTLESIVKLGADIATVLALFFAGITMILTRSQLIDARSSSRVSRAADFGRRWSELEFVKLRTSLYALLRTNPPPDLAAIQAGMARDPNMEASMRLVLNFYEEMGVIYGHNEVDKEMVKSLFKSQIRFICDKAWPYIDHLQQGGQKTACEAMLRMNQDL